jgi:uncharacterized protein (TIGR03437 family)
MIRVSQCAIVTAFALAAFQPAAGGTVSFSFNMAGTAIGVSDGNGGETFTPTNFAGTMPPFGACQATLSPDGSSLTFALSNGTTIIANTEGEAGSGPTRNASGTISGGSGIFTGATGSFQLALTATSGSASALNFTATGSGSVTAPNAPGGATLLPSSLQFQSSPGSASTISQVLILNNQGLTVLPFTVSASVASGPDWLSVSAPSPSVAAGASLSITASANPAGLKAGLYEAQIQVDYGSVSLVVPVRLLVGNAGANLQLSQTGQAFRAATGGPIPSAQTLQVTNTGVGNLTGLTATTTVTGSVPNWLHASIAAGFESQINTTVGVTVDPGTLAPGTYYGQVSFNLPKALNAPQSLSVEMVVATALPTFQPAMVLIQSPLNPDGSVGPLPPTATVILNNPSLEPLDYTVTVPLNIVDAPLFTAPATSGTVPAGGTQQILISLSGNCWTTQTCIGGIASELGFAYGAWSVNFPAINYSYVLWASLQFTGAISTSPPIPTWGTPPPGLVDLLSTTKISSPSAIGRNAEIHAVTSHSTPTTCTPSVLDGSITSQSLSGFQTVVGQPTPLQVTIFDNCGNNLNSGTVVASFSSGDSEVPLNPLGAGQWAATWVPSNASTSATITLQGVSDSGLFGSGVLQGVVTASTSTPIINSSGVVNAASSTPVIAPGSFISIYGANMAGSNTLASTTPLPDSLGSAQAFLGGESLPLQFSGAKQINAVVPYDIPVNSFQQVIVQTGNALSQPQPVLIAAAAPGVFTQNQSGNGPGAILVQHRGSSTSAMNTPSNPAKAGDALLIFCTGLGTVTPKVSAGSIAPASPPAKIDNPVTVSVGGENATVLFAGLAPGFVGLYQMNVTVPAGIAASDTVPVVLTAGSISSVPVTVAIQ